MHPYLFEVPTAGEPFRVPAYGLMLLLAFSLAFFLLNHRARQIGVAMEKLIPVFGAAAVGGLFGARVYYLLAVETSKTLANPLSVFDCATGGLAIYGGLIGGTLGVLGVVRYFGLPTWKMVDILAPSVLVGMAVGRIGCFFAGCCHGVKMAVEDPSALVGPGFLHGTVWMTHNFPFLATQFDDPSSVVRRELIGQPLYPSQLFAVGGLLTIVVISQVMWNFRRFDGQVLATVLLLEPPLRILIESFRADERGYVWSTVLTQVPSWIPPGLLQAGGALPKEGAPVLVGVTSSQGVGLVFFAIGVALFVLRRNAGVAPEVALEEDRG